METITVSTLEAGKYPAIRDSFKRKYKVNDISAFEVGKSYDIEYIQEPYMYEGKQAFSKRITKASLASSAPVATPPTNGNGKHYSAEDKEAFARKDLWMARMAALKASVEMVKAEVEMYKNKDDQGMNLYDMQQRFYKEFLAEITKA